MKKRKSIAIMQYIPGIVYILYNISKKIKLPARGSNIQKKFFFIFNNCKISSSTKDNSVQLMQLNNNTK